MATKLSAHDLRYERLKAVRIAWCSHRDRDCLDRSNVVIQLDGEACIDIPAFYLALGRAVNGQNGYYGGCLDALDDCLLRGFGLAPPFTLEIRRADKLRMNLCRSSQLLWRKKWEAEMMADPEMTDSALADLGIPLDDLPIEVPSYFDSIMRILADHDVNVVLR